LSYNPQQLFGPVLIITLIAIICLIVVQGLGFTTRFFSLSTIGTN
jgi:hypothetical protein